MQLVSNGALTSPSSLSVLNSSTMDAHTVITAVQCSKVTIQKTLTEKDKRSTYKILYNMSLFESFMFKEGWHLDEKVTDKCIGLKGITNVAGCLTNRGIRNGIFKRAVQEC